MSPRTTIGCRTASITASIALGAVAGVTTYVLVPAAHAGVEATRAPGAVAAAATPGTADTTGDREACGPFGRRGGWGGGGGWAPGEVPDRVEDLLADLPAELRADLEAAWELEDPSERRDAILAVRQAALDGDYGADVRERAEDAPWAGGWRAGRGWGAGWGAGHGRPGWAR